MINCVSDSNVYWLMMLILLYQIDHVGNPSWQAQVSGTKLWLLIPPPECYFECAESLRATVGPGEISMSSLFEILCLKLSSTLTFSGLS